MPVNPANLAFKRVKAAKVHHLLLDHQNRDQHRGRLRPYHQVNRNRRV